MAIVDIPPNVSALYDALRFATSVTELLETGDELYDALGHWLTEIRETQSHRLGVEEAKHREVAEMLRDERSRSRQRRR